MLVLAALAACMAAVALAPPARGAFVHALGSPFPTATPPRALDVLDADGNGIADVAAGGLDAAATVVRLGDGSGWLGRARPFGVPGPLLALAGGDLNGDGLRDHATIVSGDPRRLLVYAAQPGGGYATATALADAGGASDVEIANVDAAGLAELVVADGASVRVLRAVGGEWVAGPAIATGAAGPLTRIAPAHLDGDGRLDLVAADGGGAPAVILLRGDGAGGFASLGRRATGLPAPPTSVAAADLDGDGHADVVAGSPSGRFAVLHGNGAGGLAAIAGSPFAVGAASAIDDLVAHDVNRDGQADLVAANRAGSISVLLNSGTGLLAAAPAALDFGALPAGSPPQVRTVTLRAIRGRVHITRHDVYGSASFARADGDCVGRTLLLGQACTLTVSFTPPRRAGEEQSLLSVDANAAAVVVALVGAARPPLIASTRVRPRRVRPGRRMALAYELSEGARIRLRLERASIGRRAGARRRVADDDGETTRRPHARSAARERRCMPPRRGNLRRPRCRIWEPLRAYRPRRAVAGENVLRLRARARGRLLEPGVYRLALTAVDAFRNRSEETYAAFRVARRPSPQRRPGRPGPSVAVAGRQAARREVK